MRNELEMQTRSRFVRSILCLTILEAHRYTPPDNWRTISVEEYISEYLIYNISVPRMYGKSWAMQEIYNALDDLGDDRVYFADSRETFQTARRGQTRPFGDKVEILIFEETFDKRHIKAIAENWRFWGYDTYPKIIVLRTKPYVEDYKRG